jgi:hypothetical protein
VEVRSFGRDASAGAAADRRGDLIEEGLVVGHRVEVGGAAQEQCLDNPSLEVAMGRLDTAVLVGTARVVAACRHPVMRTQRGIPGCEIFLLHGREVLEGR